MKRKLLLLGLIILTIISSTCIIVAKENNYNLQGYIIYVDAGHGGKDNGANYQNVLEDEINLSISKLLMQNLVDLGVIVYSSRDGDYDLASNYDKNRKAKDLKKRVELINSINPDLFISIHLNTYKDEKVSGGQVFYQNNKNSQYFASILQNEFNKLSNKEKKPKLGDYYLLNNTQVMGVIIECGFLTNPQDLVNLVKEKYQEKIVKLIVSSIYDYFSKSINVNV